MAKDDYSLYESQTVKTDAQIANEAKRARLELPTRKDPYTQAWRRVQASPRLRRYESIILADWPDGDDHFRWVARGTVGEIEAWAQQIQEDSDGT